MANVTDQTQISALISTETKARLEAYVREYGVKRSFLIERALQHHLAALDEIPAGVAVRAEVTVMRARVLMHQAAKISRQTEVSAEDQLRAQQNYREAINTLRAAQDQDTLSAQATGTAMYLIGLCYLELGDFQAALGQFTRTAELHADGPEKLAATLEQAELSRQLGRDEDALAAYLRVLAEVGDVEQHRNPWVPQQELRDRLLAACRHYLQTQNFPILLPLVRRLEPLLHRADGADLIVLPELANSGYNFPHRAAAWEASEPIGSSPFLEFLTRKCAEHVCEIVAGLNERAGDRLYSSAVLLSARGVEGIYRKLHLFMNEPDIFQPGDLGLPVFDREYGTVGIQICFDWAVCEPWRILMLKGADIICHPSNLVIPGKAQRAIPVYAMTNRLFIATANRIGTEGELTFTGGSLIADPEGATLAEAPQTDSAMLVADVDLTRARDKALTPRNDAIDDRRPDQYGELCAVE